jgi:hypothetical protein
MSWAAHDLEPYVIQRHFGKSVAFVPVLIGSYSPDLATKWFVYGINVLGIEVGASDPAHFHRGWPGVGFLHSLAFGVVMYVIIRYVFGSKLWAVSFLIGQWAHAITDAGDTLGTMLFFPFSTAHVSVGAWAYAGQNDRLVDAAAYFSGLGWAWDGVWVVLALMSWRVLTREYFLTTIVAADPGFWNRAGRVLPMTALLALYRAAFFYGICRWIAWTIWAHVLHDYPFDLHWGGPDWVPKVD